MKGTVGESKEAEQKELQRALLEVEKTNQLKKQLEDEKRELQRELEELKRKAGEIVKDLPNLYQSEEGGVPEAPPLDDILVPLAPPLDDEIPESQTPLVESKEGKDGKEGKEVKEGKKSRGGGGGGGPKAATEAKGSTESSFMLDLDVLNNARKSLKKSKPEDGPGAKPAPVSYLAALQAAVSKRREGIEVEEEGAQPDDDFFD